MRRADRLLQIIQILRRREPPVTAYMLADELEVSLRTIYRDVTALIASGVPVDGEAGVGYRLGRGYDLPPLMFTPSELEALMLGGRMVQGRGDGELAHAARNAIAKIAAIIPKELEPLLKGSTLFAPKTSPPEKAQIDEALLRYALRYRYKCMIAYSDEKSRETKRTVWPVAIGYFETTRLIAAWCELRQDFRHFRTDRITTLDLLEARYPAHRLQLFDQWRAQERKNGYVYYLGDDD